MTKLEDEIILRRAQLQVLDWAANALLHHDGPVIVEIGAADDVTADHLRERLPKAKIQSIDASADAFAAANLTNTVTLIHATTPNGTGPDTTALGELLKAQGAKVCHPDAIIVARCDIADDAFTPVDIADYDRQSGYRCYRFKPS